VIFKLSLNPLDSSHPGYQLPIDSSQVNEKSFSELKKLPNPMKNKPLSQKTNKSLDKTCEAAGKKLETNAEAQENNELYDKKPKKTHGEMKNTENTRQRAFRGGRYRGGRARGGRFMSRNPSKKQEPGMEKYKLIRDYKENQRKDNEIYVSANGNPIFAIKNVLMMFKQKMMKEVIVKASGKAIPKAIHIVEEVKKKELDLHQQNSFSKTLFKNHYKPTEEGLDDVYKDRSVNGIEIVLSKSSLDTNHPGYQGPLPQSQVTNLSLSEVEKL
jgi:DNA-binding protein